MVVTNLKAAKYMQNYNDKPDGYFARARTEILPLLPHRADRVLEIGCGSGATLAWLKEIGLAGHTTGIELAKHMADVAVDNVDCLVTGDAEAMLADGSSASVYDLVLCLDVLEHMVDPWQMMHKIAHVLKPGGLVVSSIPNVRHFGVLMPLTLKGQWNYLEEGILDRTHLRFFTRDSATELMKTSGLILRAVKPNFHPSSKSGLLSFVSLGLLTDFLTVQYLICAQKSV